MLIKGEKMLRYDQTILEQVNRRRQEILNTLSPCGHAHEHRAFLAAYNELTDQQKIAFILAGGRAQLFQKQKAQRYEGSSDTRTGGLPVLSSY